MKRSNPEFVAWSNIHVSLLDVIKEFDFDISLEGVDNTYRDWGMSSVPNSPFYLLFRRSVEIWYTIKRLEPGWLPNDIVRIVLITLTEMIPRDRGYTDRETLISATPDLVLRAICVLEVVLRILKMHKTWRIHTDVTEVTEAPGGIIICDAYITLERR